MNAPDGHEILSECSLTPLCSHLGSKMAQVNRAQSSNTAPAFEGPGQHGRGVRGQYVYLVVFNCPKPDVVERFGARSPAEFSREAFNTLVVQAHGREVRAAGGGAGGAGA